MDPLHLAVAILPLAIYCLFIGLLNLFRRPTLLTGVWDALLLALGLSGWVLIGPMELFLPDTAVANYGVWVWIPLVCLYGLLVLLIVLLLRPRLIIYNVSSEQLRPILAEAVNEMDDRARWAGDCLTMPQQRIQLHVETQPGLRQVQLVAIGSQQDLDAWRHLSRALALRLKELAVPVNPRGATFALIGASLLVAIGITWVTHSQEVAAAIRELRQISPHDAP